MKAMIIDGKQVAGNIRREIRDRIEQRTAGGRPPPAWRWCWWAPTPPPRSTCATSAGPVKGGVFSKSYDLAADTPEDELLALIDDLNADGAINGILVQLPLPGHIDPETVIERIHPDKDVDGFHPYNVGRLALRLPRLRPCTPHGIMTLLRYANQPFKGQHAVVVGASNIVGRPMALELLLAGATVTVCHRFTDNLADLVGQADILVSATGKRGLIEGTWIKPGAVVIDVGINRLDDGRLVGDVDFDAARERASWITPVPGGVGPMTMAMLLENTLYAAELAGAAEAVAG
ncbi:MAG: bifunctional methylenetetrahydrofolate dehydrogenase/methenyltetrahydrofolate cyclohydrolase FolD [Gammaproteobacteria bacterium]|nr:bifunctional methylenetetrahydrofolate dehydrogenase/methenyltetrahydrofolate cyclohydrolase FolD [Gammaproteobacteria bacterium]